LHDEFEISGGPKGGRGVPAITVGAGTRWLEAYQAATAHGRYVQGGGCTSVGAAGGFTLGGGFGTFSKRFGTAAGNLLEAEVVTADGEIRVANRVRNPHLFWALRGGGGGTFGVVTKLTMRTHDLADTVGLVLGTITAPSDPAYRALIRQFVRFFPTAFADPHWGEQVRFAPDNTIQISMNTVDLDEAGARAVWEPFRAWLEENGYEQEFQFLVMPFRFLWDIDFLRANLPDLIRTDDRVTPPKLFWWAGNQSEVSQFVDSMQSRWLPIRLFRGNSADRLADALYEASRIWSCTMHVNKGLAGSPNEVRERERHTSLNPVALDAACLLMMGSEQQPAYPGVPGHEPDLEQAEANARTVTRAMRVIREVTPGSGAYSNEADYFEPGWQRSFWGTNYRRLLAVKRKYDPNNLFRVHHGVGSER
jgi:FAD/FMN-containing dehydrogenase